MSLYTIKEPLTSKKIGHIQKFFWENYATYRFATRHIYHCSV